MSGRILQTLPIAQIDTRPQVRTAFDEMALRGLAQSMQAVGLQQPIVVHREGERYALIDGERRYRAALLLGWKTLLAVVDGDEAAAPDVVERQLVANCQRADLTPLEVARGIDRLMQAAQCTSAAAASKLGLSPASVSKLLALLTLPADVQEDVHAGRIKASTAYAIAKAADPARRAELVAAAKRGELKRDVADARSQKQSRAPRTKRRRVSPLTRRRLVFRTSKGIELVISGKALDRRMLIDTLEQVAVRLRQLPAEADADLALAVKSLGIDGPSDVQNVPA